MVLLVVTVPIEPLETVVVTVGNAAEGMSPAAIALNAPTPATAVACSTCVVVVSEFAPTIYSDVIGKVSVTAPDGTPKLAVVRFVDVPMTSWLAVVPK